MTQISLIGETQVIGSMFKKFSKNIMLEGYSVRLLIGIMSIKVNSSGHPIFGSAGNALFFELYLRSKNEEYT